MKKSEDEALRRFFPTGVPKPGAMTHELVEQILQEAQASLQREEAKHPYHCHHPRCCGGR